MVKREIDGLHCRPDETIRYGPADEACKEYKMSFRILLGGLLAGMVALSCSKKGTTDRSEPAGQAEVPREVALDLGNNITMKMVLIHAGSFMMGSPVSEEKRNADETPQHRVTITKPFYIGIHEVTVGQFAQFVATSGYKTEPEKGGFAVGHDGSGYREMPGQYWHMPGFSQEDDYPVVDVSWNDAAEFCKWLSKRCGKVVRLPTEAEWEYACRANSTTPFNTGEKLSNDEANYDGYYKYGKHATGQRRASPSPVGSCKPNAWGVYDMHGNVWEWCGDWYAGSYCPNEKRTDPPGPAAGQHRVARGGCWYDPPHYCRSAVRGSNAPSMRADGCGFRVVAERR